MRDPDFHEPDYDYHGAAAYGRLPQKPDFWQRLSRVMEAFLYLLVLAAILRIFWPEVEKQRELNAELDRIEQIRSEREAEVAALREEHDLLKSDREYLETIARDRLDKARDGEIIIRIERPEDKEAAAAEAAEANAPPKVKPLRP